MLARPRLSPTEMVEAGGQRISVGGGFTWIPVRAMADAAAALRDAGDTSAVAARLPLETWFR